MLGLLVILPVLGASSASLSLVPAKEVAAPFDPVRDMEKLLGGAAPRSVLLLTLYAELLRELKDVLGEGARRTGSETVLLLAIAPRLAAGGRRCRNLAWNVLGARAYRIAAGKEGRGC